MSTPTKIYLDESEMPTRWYNVVADLPEPPPPPLHPGTHQPATGDDFAALFPKALIEQEMSAERYIDIPGEVLDVYRLWRPSPLFRAHRLEKLLDTPARIYYNTRVLAPPLPQTQHCRAAGLVQRAGRIRKLTTETGAGQWGSSLAFACAQFGLECEVWQVAASFRAEPYRRTMMEIWGGAVHPSPSDVTDYGKQLLAQIRIIQALWALRSLKPWRSSRRPNSALRAR